jgi:hypothetical protein
LRFAQCPPRLDNNRGRLKRIDQPPGIFSAQPGQLTDSAYGRNKFLVGDQAFDFCSLGRIEQGEKSLITPAHRPANNTTTYNVRQLTTPWHEQLYPGIQAAAARRISTETPAADESLMSR